MKKARCGVKVACCRRRLGSPTQRAANNVAECSSNFDTDNRLLQATCTYDHTAREISTNMSFLGGPECSTGANPLAQFQKQTAADTSLQRDRLTSRQPNQLNGFRSQAQLPEDAAFQDFQQQGPQFASQLPISNETAHLERLRRQAEYEQLNGMGGGAWAGEFAEQPGFEPQAFEQQRSGAFNPQDFAQFRQTQSLSPQRQASPAFQQQSQPSYRSPMYGSSFGMGMQRPMFQSQLNNGMYQQPQQMQGKGKARVQELSDTDWEQQFAELSTEDQAEELDKEAEKAMEDELNGIDR